MSKFILAIYNKADRHRTELKNPISPNVNKTVVHNRPIRGTRKDFGDKELVGLKIHPKDKEKIKIVKRRTPQEANNYKKQKEIKKSR